MKFTTRTAKAARSIHTCKSRIRYWLFEMEKTSFITFHNLAYTCIAANERQIRMEQAFLAQYHRS